MSPISNQLALGLAAALTLASCSGPRIKLLDQPVAATKTTRALTNSAALDIANRNTLRNEQLLNLYRADSEAAIRELADRYKSQPSGARRMALAEMSADQADRLTKDQPVAAIGRYLDAAWLTKSEALAAVNQPGESPGRTLYNYSTARIARLIKNTGKGPRSAVIAPGTLRNWRLSLASGSDMADPRDYDLVVPADWLKAKGINWKHITQDGFGAAMVGHTKATPERENASPTMPPSGFSLPLNASIRFSGSSASFVLQNLMESAETSIDGRTIPLAADFSAALAFLYYDRTKSINKIHALLRPGEYDDMTGLFTLAPYQKDRIPLVLVHGLMSTGEGWYPFVNLLLADPVVREKYQLVLFNYPTGHAITESAATLRESLAEYRNTNDPGRRNPNMRNMVVLGHSMGGIITNMQIRDSGDRIYRGVFSKDLNELNLDDEPRQEIKRLAFFKANPDIDRTLLLASPLRGSAFATNKIGQLGAMLIRLPFNILDTVIGDIEGIGALTDAAQQASLRPLNSVTSLRPDNPTLQNVLDSPVRRGVKIHSIIAQTDPDAPTVDGTDGLVLYTSAHLDNAVSEKIILDADHRSMVQRDETLQEVWRILRLHAGVSQPPTSQR